MGRKCTLANVVKALFIPKWKVFKADAKRTRTSILGPSYLDHKI